MTSTPAVLPSWRPGAARDTLLAFLDDAEAVPIDQRVAAFDNDGTLWCEQPLVQLLFFVDALRAATSDDPTLSTRPEYAAVLDGDQAAIGALGLERVALALAELFAGQEPEAFTEQARAFMARASHPTLGLALRRTVYQPMIELLDELRRRQFTTFIVSGGGTEFVRAVSDELYQVPGHAVVGTLIDYDFARRDDGRPVLYRTARVLGGANEGAAKVNNIQTHLGRRPILGCGNSGGDREMLEWACAGDGPGLALLVDHDDAEREFAYRSVAATFAESEPITTVGERLGWLVVSMERDWERVFPA